MDITAVFRAGFAVTTSMSDCKWGVACIKGRILFASGMCWKKLGRRRTSSRSYASVSEGVQNCPFLYFFLLKLKNCAKERKESCIEKKFFKISSIHIFCLARSMLFEISALKNIQEFYLPLVTPWLFALHKITIFSLVRCLHIVPFFNHSRLSTHENKDTGNSRKTASQHIKHHRKLTCHLTKTFI